MSDSSGNDFLSYAEQWLWQNKIVILIAWVIIGGFVLSQLPEEYQSIQWLNGVLLFPVWLFLLSIFWIFPFLILEFIRIKLTEIFPNVLVNIVFLGIGVYSSFSISLDNEFIQTLIQLFTP